MIGESVVDCRIRTDTDADTNSELLSISHSFSSLSVNPSSKKAAALSDTDADTNSERLTILHLMSSLSSDSSSKKAAAPSEDKDEVNASDEIATKWSRLISYSAAPSCSFFYWRDSSIRIRAWSEYEDEYLAPLESVGVNPKKMHERIQATIMKNDFGIEDIEKAALPVGFDEKESHTDTVTSDPLSSLDQTLADKTPRHTPATPVQSTPQYSCCRRRPKNVRSP